MTPQRVGPRATRSGLPLAAALLAFALAAPAGAQPAPASACAFRAVAIAALFSAAADADDALAALEAGDAAAASEGLSGAAVALLAEKRRVRDEWRSALAAREKKQLAKSLNAARKRALRAARAAGRARANAAALADDAIATIDDLLATQAAAHAAACEGAEVELLVPELRVGAGTTRTLPAGAKVVADDGIVILGTLAVRGPGGGVWLETRAGDIVIEGRLDGTGDPPVPDEPGLPPAGAARAARATNDGRPTCGSAGTVWLWAARAIVIGERAVTVTGDGASCTPIEVRDWAELHETNVSDSFGGRHGGDGGDIRLNPNVLQLSDANAVVRFEARAAGAPPPLWPGRGGNGQSFLVAETLLPPASASVFHVLGGDGGDSGVAETGMSDVRIVRDADVPVMYYPPAAGGAGGSVAWSMSDTAMLPLALSEIRLHGGHGGKGIAAGGDGGLAEYRGERHVAPEGVPAVNVLAVGGNGGWIFDAPGETLVERGFDESVTGGRGGNADARGHRGAHGGWAARDGEAGGTVTVRGGSGGSIVSPGVLQAARVQAGAGGDGSGVGGRGGDGRPGSCEPMDVEAGADGGDGGTADVRGGDGGGAPDGTGGSGGAARLVMGASGGFGGAGDPSGACGDPGRSEAAGGPGGEGRSAGANGAIVDVVHALPCDASEGTIACSDIGPAPSECGGGPGFFLRTIVRREANDYSWLYDTLTTTRTAGNQICNAGVCTWRRHTRTTTVNIAKANTGPGSTNESEETSEGGPDPYPGYHCPPNATNGTPAHGRSGTDSSILVVVPPPRDPPLPTITYRTDLSHGETGSHWCGNDEPRVCCSCPNCSIHGGNTCPF